MNEILDALLGELLRADRDQSRKPVSFEVSPIIHKPAVRSLGETVVHGNAEITANPADFPLSRQELI